MIASTLACAGYGVRIEDGTVVVAFKGSKFEPYKLQRIHLIDDFRKNEVHKARNVPPPLMLKQFPHDKIEYWNMLTEDAFEAQQRLVDNAAEKAEERAQNLQEVLDTVNEVWGHPRLLTIQALLAAEKERQKKRADEDAEMREKVLENKEELA